MATQPPLTDDEISRLRSLLKIEDIRKTRLLYSQYMDHQNIDGLADLFTEQALCEFGPYGEWRGRETIRSNYKDVFSGDSAELFHSMHNSNNHWVELTSDAHAVGRSYLIDAVTSTPKEENPILWFGVYDEEYELVSDRWLISRCSLQFLWPERHVSEDFTPEFPAGRTSAV